jgi:hypothetical protein
LKGRPSKKKHNNGYHKGPISQFGPCPPKFYGNNGDYFKASDLAERIKQVANITG